jgi:hypothetical protein
VQKDETWLLLAVEVSELASKCLEWKAKTSPLGELVSSTYLLFIEEICRFIQKVAS